MECLSGDVVMQKESERSSIAWFRLEEFVARRERERALSVYRLLGYSWNDDAYSLKLGADLMRAFQDFERAMALYQESASAYEQMDRIAAAAFVYERALSMPVQGCTHAALKMVALFDLLNLQFKIAQHCSLVIEHLLVNSDPEAARRVIMQWAFSPETAARLLERLVLIAIQMKQHRKWHEYLVAAYVTDFHEQDAYIVPFMHQLERLDGALYKFACTQKEEPKYLQN